MLFPDVDPPLIARPGFAPEPGPDYDSCEVHEGVFSPDECATIIRLGLGTDPEEAGLEADGGGEVRDLDIRLSRTAWLPADDDTWWIYERLAGVALAANRRYGFDLHGFEEDLQFTIYDDPGAFYTWHQDGLDGGVAHRKLTLVTQLSHPEDYVGADLQFFDIEEDDLDERRLEYRGASRQQGAVIAFPTFEYHRVLPLRSGVRYSLVCWIGGPRFR